MHSVIGEVDINDIRSHCFSASCITSRTASRPAMSASIQQFLRQVSANTGGIHVA